MRISHNKAAKAERERVVEVVEDLIPREGTGQVMQDFYADGLYERLEAQKKCDNWTDEELNLFLSKRQLHRRRII